MIDKNRYRLYREHKFLFSLFTEVLRSVATFDLRQQESRCKLTEQMTQLEEILQSHAKYEETRIHQVLKNHHSLLFTEVEQQHKEQEVCFKNLNEKVTLIKTASEEEIPFLSYELYLDTRKFFADNLTHFDYEERVLMPEIQRLLSDDDIKEIDRISYAEMQPADLIQMVTILFPHMNYEDRFIFLKEIKDSQPQKFGELWDDINPLLPHNEKKHLSGSLKIQESTDN